MKKLKIESKQKIIGFAFVGPWLLGFAVFSAYPLLYSLYMSFNKVKVSGSALKMEWMGWENYNKALLRDAEVMNNLIKVLQNTVIIIPIIVVFAIIMALLLNEEFKGRSFIRAVFFLPVLLTSGNLIESLTAQGQGTVSFLKSDTINSLLANIGGSLGETLTMVIDSFLIILWYSGVQMLILIAGMQSVNPSVYEAATIDGAGKWESLWLITLPNLVPFILLATIYTVVDQFTAPFNKIMDFIMGHMNNVKTGYGYASAISFLYFLLILGMIGIVFLMFRRSVTEKKR
ncbi:MAG: sugar ABC transporter permease [Lachnospiraceae bacterium]|uniref:carbohydrate ABC transporter permease n=1 Tax=uncultured Acetatifactor sp. TaxID=1671927 RepID=UPI00260617CB|nr:sugar ABC transporter permease [uncultured Acetatifactor sp.]MCI8788422.1 sugar ABC transporter permease [Lachnospiraceae bacterium]